MNWAGTSGPMRERLVALGLVTHENRTSPGRHTQWSKYLITELGESVLCGAAFDAGLTEGRGPWLAKLRAIVNEEHGYALIENARRDVERGLRYEAMPHVEAEVRRVLWKNVEVIKKGKTP